MEMYEPGLPEVLKDGRIIADDFKPIPADHCRKCHRKIKPYTERFYQIDGCSGFIINREKSYRNSYCKSCAKKLAGINTVMRLPKITERYHTWKNGEPVEVKKFNNGITEESYTKEQKVLNAWN